MTWRALIDKLRASAFFGLTSGQPLPTAVAGVSRRQFLKVAGIAAATIALLPEALALDEPLPALDAPVVGISLAEVDSLLCEVYRPLIMSMLNEPNSIMRFMAKDEPDGRPVVVPVKVGRNYYASYRR